MNRICLILFHMNAMCASLRVTCPGTAHGTPPVTHYMLQCSYHYVSPAPEQPTVLHHVEAVLQRVSHIRLPRTHLLSVAPAVAPEMPSAMLVWLHALPDLPSVKPIGHAWSYLACRTGRLTPAYQPLIRSSLQRCWEWGTRGTLTRTGDPDVCLDG
jgi:hypothetical protein